MRVMEPGIQISTTELDDASELNADGTYEYRYRGWSYVIDMGDIRFKARRYRDTPEEVLFLSYLEPTTSNDRSLTRAMLDNPRFRAAALHLLDALKTRTIRALVEGGYEQVIKAPL